MRGSCSLPFGFPEIVPFDRVKLLEISLGINNSGFVLKMRHENYWFCVFFLCALINSWNYFTWFECALISWGNGRRWKKWSDLILEECSLYSSFFGVLPFPWKFGITFVHSFIFFCLQEWFTLPFMMMVRNFLKTSIVLKESSIHMLFLQKQREFFYG